MNLLRIEDHTYEIRPASRNFEQPSLAVATTNANGLILTITEGFAEMLGFEPRELIGRRISSLLHSEDSMPPLQERSERRFINSDGEVVPASVTTSPVLGNGRVVEQIVWLFEENRRPTLVHSQNVTDRRRMEAQREQADRLTSLGRMAATIAHDFNNVLMGISPFVEVIRRGRSVETSLDHIGRAVKRGKRITEEILRFTRSSQPQVAPFEVEPWIDNIALEARSLVPSNCHVETFVQSPDLAIDGDANQLQAVFTSLILNARDAMPRGGTLTIEVLRDRPNSRQPFGLVEHPERFAHCIVRDDGCGMSAETLRHIYEPLFTTRKNGTGLGLAVAYQVVQRHGGHIFVESTLGVGTAFHLFLPLATPKAADTANDAASAIVKGVMTDLPHHVLLVEDDATVAAGLVSLLELEGLVVDVVETGAAAIRAIDQIRPNLLVLDIGLPDMDGTRVYEAIAEKMPSLPVIFSTAHADRAKLDHYLAQPNVDYLLKPYDKSTLLRAIGKVLL
jgi:two-component system cell cycle sensor histidine kinase/response regulator CckA